MPLDLARAAGTHHGAVRAPTHLRLPSSLFPPCGPGVPVGRTRRPVQGGRGAGRRRRAGRRFAGVRRAARALVDLAQLRTTTKFGRTWWPPWVVLDGAEASRARWLEDIGGRTAVLEAARSEQRPRAAGQPAQWEEPEAAGPPVGAPATEVIHNCAWDKGRAVGGSGVVGIHSSSPGEDRGAHDVQREQDNRGRFR